MRGCSCCADWLDDDVSTKEAQQGVLHAIEYFVPPTEAHGESGTEHPPACVPACDGKVYAHAANGLALLERYHFRVTRQHVLLADGGAALRPHSSHRTRAVSGGGTRAV